MGTVVPLRGLRYLLLAFVVAALVGAPLVPLTSVWAIPMAQALTEDQVAGLVAQLRATPPDYADDFDAVSGDWTVIYDVEVSTYYKGGQRRISVDAGDLLVWSRLNTEYSDFYAEVETTQWEGRAEDLYGIIFRYVNRDNFYVFAIGSDGFYMVRRIVDDQWQYLVDWTESDAIVVGEEAVNQLGVVASGDSLTVLVNGTVLAQVQDSSHPTGTIGIVAGTFEETGLDIGFDNFQLWLLPDEPLPTPTPARRDRPSRRIQVTPTPQPTVTPTEEATAEPTAEPVEEPTATPVPPLLPTPLPTEEPEEEPEVEAGVLFDPSAIRRTPPALMESFDAEPEGWLPTISNSMRYGVVDGELEFGVDAPNSLGWTTLPTVVPDYYVEVDTRFTGDVQEAEWGFLYRVQDGRNFLFYAINNLGMASVWRFEEGEWTLLLPWAAYSFLESGEGAVNRLGLLARGDSYAFYANGFLLGQMTDDTFAGGGLALTVGTFADPEVTVYFDELALWELEPVEAAAPSPTPLPTVAPEAEDEPEGDDSSDDSTLVPSDLTVEGMQALVDSFYANAPAIFDDFRRDDGLWSLEDTDAGQTYFARRSYHVELDEAEIYLFGTFQGLSEEDEADGYFAEVTVSFADLQSDGSGGFVFKRMDNSNFYYLTIDVLGRYQLWARRGGDWTELVSATTAAAWDPDSDENRLGVVANRGMIGIVVNGMVEATLVDPGMPAGGIGLMAQSGRDSLPHTVIFDDFRLWHIRQ